MVSRKNSRRRLFKGGNADNGDCDGAVSLFTKGGRKRTLKHSKKKGRRKKTKGGSSNLFTNFTNPFTYNSTSFYPSNTNYYSENVPKI